MPTACARFRNIGWRRRPRLMVLAAMEHDASVSFAVLKGTAYGPPAELPVPLPVRLASFLCAVAAKSGTLLAR